MKALYAIPFKVRVSKSWNIACKLVINFTKGRIVLAVWSWWGVFIVFGPKAEHQCYTAVLSVYQTKNLKISCALTVLQDEGALIICYAHFKNLLSQIQPRWTVYWMVLRFIYLLSVCGLMFLPAAGAVWKCFGTKFWHDEQYKAGGILLHEPGNEPSLSLFAVLKCMMGKRVTLMSTFISFFSIKMINWKQRQIILLTFPSEITADVFKRMKV